MLLDDYLRVGGTVVFGNRVTAVNIANAAKWFYETSGQEEWDWETDFPNVAPPWALAWYEYPAPVEFNLDGFMQRNELRDAGVAKLGVMVHSVPIKPESRNRMPAENLMARTLFPKADRAHRRNLPEPADVRWMAGYNIIGKIRGKPEPLGGVFDYIGPDGRILWANRLIVPFKEGLDHHVETFLLPVMFAISLIHCKNTSLIDVPVPSRMNRARKRRGRPEKVAFKTINIEPMRTVLRGEGRSESNGLRKAMHICRGHFATYTEDRPLFGKLSGTFWKPMHVRGDAKEGAVVKDYKVSAPV